MHVFPFRYDNDDSWYRLAVFALWLAAMSWLAVGKILPPFFTGEPPVSNRWAVTPLGPP